MSHIQGARRVDPDLSDIKEVTSDVLQKALHGITLFILTELSISSKPVKVENIFYHPSACFLLKFLTCKQAVGRVQRISCYMLSATHTEQKKTLNRYERNTYNCKESLSSISVTHFYMYLKR